jgi:Flp pilus assembly protein TadD
MHPKPPVLPSPGAALRSAASLSAAFRARGALVAGLLAAGLPACSTLDLAGTALEAAPVQPAALQAAPVQAAPPFDASKDDLALAKDHFRAGHFGLAEVHFRRAVEASKGSAEGWLGLAASYDQLKRYDLADRAYREALKLTGPTPEFLNNRGYSYLLRGDIRRASQDLSAAAAADPGNERIQNNLKALDQRARRRV